MARCGTACLFPRNFTCLCNFYVLHINYKTIFQIKLLHSIRPYVLVFPFCATMCKSCILESFGCKIGDSQDYTLATFVCNIFYVDFADFRKIESVVRCIDFLMKLLRDNKFIIFRTYENCRCDIYINFWGKRWLFSWLFVYLY